MHQINELRLFIQTLGRKSFMDKTILCAKLLLVILASFFKITLPQKLSLSFNEKGFVFFINKRLDISILNEVFIQEEYRHENLSNVSHVLDLGSNIGATASYFALMYPESSITAVEANPRIIKQLEKNLSQFKNTEVIPRAISTEHNKEITFYIQDSHLGSSLLKSKGGTPQTLLTTNIERLKREKGVEFFDLIKFDVEGVEGEIFSNKPEEYGKNYIGEVHYDLINQEKDVFLNQFKKFQLSETILKKNRSLIFAKGL